MSSKRILISLFNIKSGESRPIGFLMLFSFFMGAAIAFFYTAATTLLLADYETSVLPMAYILSGLLGYFIWFLSSRLEKRYSFSNLMFIYLGFLILSVLFFVVGVSYFHSPWVSFVMFIWIRVVVFGTAIIFWGVAARLFNLRQGKRIFGLISSGEVLSQIIGFLSIPLLMQVFTTSNLVFIAFLNLLLCLLILYLITRNFAEKLSSIPQKKRKAISGQNKRPSINKQKYFYLLFTLALLPMFSIYYVDYIFLGQTKIEFPDQALLASFLGLFLGFVALTEFVLKTFVSGHLISKYGIKLGLIALPVSLLFSTVFASIAGSIYGTTALFFSFVLMSKLLERAVRSSINDPSFQILYQPIPVDYRLYYQSRIEGIPKALGNLAAGIILLIFTSLGFLNLVHFNYFFVLILLFWISIATKQYQEYRSTLKKIISEEKTHKSKVNGRASNLEILTTTLINSDYKYFKQIFHFFNKSESAQLSSAMEYLLKKSPDSLIKAILNEIQQQKMVQLIKLLEELQKQKRFKSHKNAITECLNTFAHIRGLRYEALSELTKSGDPEKKILAINLLAQSGRYNTFKLVIELLQDSDVKVRKAALLAAGTIKRHELWIRIIDHLLIPEYQREAISAIEGMGDSLLDELESLFGRLTENIEVRIEIIKLYEKLGGTKVIQFLKNKINYPEKEIRYQALLSLSRLEYNATLPEQAHIKQVIKDELSVIIWIMAAFIDLEGCKDGHHILKALEYEIACKKEDIFLLLSLLYDSKTIKHVQEKIESRDKDSRVYALEIIDMMVTPDIKERIIPIMDDLSYKECIQQYLYLFPQQKQSIEDRLCSIINKDYTKINPWTKACSLNMLAEYPGETTEQICAANILNPNRILMELAVKQLFELNSQRYIDNTLNLPIEQKQEYIFKLLQRGELSEGFFLFNRILAFKNTTIFKDIPETELINIVPLTELIELEKGQGIQLQQKDLYVIASGEGTLTNGLKNISYSKYAVLGNILPEIWLNENCEFKALERTELLGLEVNIFYGLMKNYPGITNRMVVFYSEN